DPHARAYDGARRHRDPRPRQRGARPQDRGGHAAGRSALTGGAGDARRPQRGCTAVREALTALGGSGLLGPPRAAEDVRQADPVRRELEAAAALNDEARALDLLARVARHVAAAGYARPDRRVHEPLEPPSALA